jgi:hypothetical protein
MRTSLPDPPPLSIRLQSVDPCMLPRPFQESEKENVEKRGGDIQ